jgi:hypothetical protein
MLHKPDNGAYRKSVIFDWKAAEFSSAQILLKPGKNPNKDSKSLFLKVF